MATFLDVGLMQHFGVVFVLLLVFIILFGLLEYIKPFGDGKKGIHAVIAVMVALLFLVSKVATNMVSFMVPWFMVVAIFIFFTLFLVRIFGVGEKEMKELIKDDNVYPWLLVFVGLILIFALSTAFGQGLLEKGGSTSSSTNYSASSSTSTTSLPSSGTAQTTSTSTSSFTTNLLNTLRNPKVLGLLFIFIMSAFALLFLTRTSKTL